MEKRKASYKRYREKNKERRLLYAKSRQKKAVDHIRNIKSNRPCTDCGIIYPHYVLDFDHIRDKKYGIADMPSRLKSISDIDIEIAKCELVCSNCHRIRTHGRIKKRIDNTEA